MITFTTAVTFVPPSISLNGIKIRLTYWTHSIDMINLGGRGTERLIPRMISVCFTVPQPTKDTCVYRASGLWKTGLNIVCGGFLYPPPYNTGSSSTLRSFVTHLSVHFSVSWSSTLLLSFYMCADLSKICSKWYTTSTSASRASKEKKKSTSVPFIMSHTATPFFFFFGHL